jgi:hypothetical protein
MTLRLPLAVAAVLILAGPAIAQHAAAPPAAAPGRTVDLQGDPRAFMDNPQIRAFYALSVETLGKGTKGVDVAAYEKKSMAIFGEFGVARGVGAAAMQDHLKLIPRQVVDIVKADPHVLDSFEAFSDAMIGPR